MDLQNIKLKLTIQNPWWKEGGVGEDQDLKVILKSPLHYRPEPIKHSECRQEGVITLRGPRRVGKTASLKMLIHNLILKDGWQGKHILWINAETIRNMADFEAYIESAVEAFDPKLLCIDEVSSVKGWQKVIKKLRDTGTLAERCTILTGSSAHDIKIGVERMAGRRGVFENPDRVLLPMSFSDFKNQMKGHPFERPEDLETLFLQWGGFPFRVSMLKQDLLAGRKPIPDSDLQIFDDVIFYEFNRRKLDRNTAVEIIGRLATIGAHACSYLGFVKPLSISKETAKKYIDALGDAFLLATISSYDTKRNRIAPKKDKKFLWIDPALGRLAHWQQQGPLLDEGALAECAVSAHLIRNCEHRIWEGVSSPRNVYTWKSASGHEIDFLLVNKAKGVRFPIEVKFQESVSDWDFQVMEKAFGKGILVTKSESRKRKKADAMSLGSFLEKKLNKIAGINGPSVKSAALS